MRRRALFINTALTLIFCALAWGWYSQRKRVQTEEARAELEHARVEFEMGIFPYSLVVGYVDNFLMPVLTTVADEDPGQCIVISMPNSYDELNDSLRYTIYKKYLLDHYEVADNVNVVHISIPGRKRGASVARIGFSNNEQSILYDNVRTVVAFKAVIDYKMSDQNPVPLSSDMTPDELTRYYTESFIEQTVKRLGDISQYCLFVKDTNELESVLTSMGIPQKGER